MVFQLNSESQLLMFSLVKQTYDRHFSDIKRYLRLPLPIFLIIVYIILLQVIFASNHEDLVMSCSLHGSYRSIVVVRDFQFTRLDKLSFLKIFFIINSVFHVQAVAFTQ